MTRPAAWGRAKSAGRRPRAHPEQDLQIAAVQYLRLALPDCQIIHCPNGGKRGKAEGAIFKAMGVQAGVADLLVCRGALRYAVDIKGEVLRLREERVIPPLIGWIELKAGKGRLNEAQKAFSADCEAKGILWAEARSLNEIESIVRMWGLKPRATVG